jgi:hypothetical protein
MKLECVNFLIGKVLCMSTTDTPYIEQFYSMDKLWSSTIFNSAETDYFKRSMTFNKSAINPIAVISPPPPPP